MTRPVHIEPIDVLHAGGPADGVGDDAAAINSLIASMRPGRRLRLMFPSGYTFRIETELDLNGIEQFTVEAHGATILNRSGSHLFDAQQCDGVSLLGGRYYGAAVNTGTQDPTDVFIRFDGGSTRFTARDLDLYEIRGTAFDDATETRNGLAQPAETKTAMTIIDGIRFTDVRTAYNTFGGGGSQVAISNVHMLRGTGGFKFDGQQDQTTPGTFEGSRAITMTNATFRDMFSTSGEKGCIQIEENVYGVTMSNIVGDGLGDDVALLRVTAGQTVQPVGEIVLNGFSAKNVANTLGGVGTPVAVLLRNSSGIRVGNGEMDGCGIYSDASDLDVANVTVDGSKIHVGSGGRVFASAVRTIANGQAEAFRLAGGSEMYDTGCFFDSGLPNESTGSGVRVSSGAVTF